MKKRKKNGKKTDLEEIVLKNGQKTDKKRRQKKNPFLKNAIQKKTGKKTDPFFFRIPSGKFRFFVLKTDKKRIETEHKNFPAIFRQFSGTFLLGPPSLF